MRPFLNSAAIATVFATSSLAACGAMAQTIGTTRALNFGTFVVADFDVVGEITIFEAFDTFSTNANIYPIVDARRGVYTVTAAPVSTAFTVSTSPATNYLGGPGSKTFTMDNLTVSPGVHATDGAGEAVFYIGGRLRNTGDGDTYTNGTYNDNFNVTVTW